MENIIKTAVLYSNRYDLNTLKENTKLPIDWLDKLRRGKIRKNEISSYLDLHAKISPNSLHIDKLLTLSEFSE